MDFQARIEAARRVVDAAGVVAVVLGALLAALFALPRVVKGDRDAHGMFLGHESG